MQLFGTCREATVPRARTAQKLYGRRFRGYAQLMAATSGEAERHAEALRSLRFYRFVPTRIKILDERTFGGGVFVVVQVRKR